MKKILTVLLAFVMCVCLVNLNNNNTKAETELTPNGEGIYELSNLEELNAFFNDFTFDAKAKLKNDITITSENLYSTYSLDVYGNKELDLNGHNLIINKTIIFEEKGDALTHVIRIFNSDTNNASNIYPADNANIKALIVAKANDNKRLSVSIGKEETGKIIIDGKNRNNFVGVASGFSWDASGKLVPFNSKVSTVLNSVEFSNFNPDVEKPAAMAIMNLDDLLVKNSVIHDAYVGVAAGKLNIDTESNDRAGTNIVNSEFYNCYVAIEDGLNKVSFPTVPETSAYKMSIKNTYLHDNDYAVDYVYNENSEDDGILRFDGDTTGKYEGVIFEDNFSNIYVENAKLNSVPQIEFTANYVGPTTIYVEYNDEFYLKTDEIDLFVSKSENIPDIQLENLDYQLIISPLTNEATCYQGIVKESKSAPGFAEVKEATVTEGNNAEIILKVPTDIDTDEIHLFGPDSEEVEITKIVVDKPANESTLTTAHITFKPTAEGYYQIHFAINDSVVISNCVYITLEEPSPTPTPSPTKDESCEKVIGPTWHWNNKKGICEDTGVVKTYTR